LYSLVPLLVLALQATAASSVVEVVAALNQPQYPAAAAAAARIIRGHLSGDESVAAPKREAYTAAGAIPALVAAGTMHLNHVGVAEQVCCALINLIHTGMHNFDANWVCWVLGDEAIKVDKYEFFASRYVGVFFFFFFFLVVLLLIICFSAFYSVRLFFLFFFFSFL
jgi:hypothetical protein